MSAGELSSGSTFPSASGSGWHDDAPHFATGGGAPSTWLVTASVVLAMAAALAGMGACMATLRDQDAAAEKKIEETEYAGAEHLIYPDETRM